MPASGGLFGQFARLSSAGDLESGSSRLELDSELPTDMVDRLFSGWNVMVRSYWRVVSSLKSSRGAGI